MQSSESADFALDPPALAGFVVRDLTSGKDVTLLVHSSYGAATLERAAERLRGGRDRVVLVSAAGEGGLDCGGFLRQLGQSQGQFEGLRTDESQENDITVLTTLDPTCDRIVLLVADADCLEHGAFLAVQLACRASIRLRVVFAGQPELLARLDHPELSTLEGRLLRGVRYTYAGEDLDGAEAPVASSGRHHRAKLAIAVAACLVLVVSGVMTRWSFTLDDPDIAASPQVAALASPLPTLPSEQTAQSIEAKVDPTPEPLDILRPDVPPALPGDGPGGKQTAATGRPARHGPVQLPSGSGRHGSPVREANLNRGNEPRGSGSRPVSEYRQLPGNLAVRERSGDYIGTFAAGPDGVRSFQYQP